MTNFDSGLEIPQDFGGGEEPSSVNVVFREEPEIVENLKYKIQIGKRDRVAIEFKMSERKWEEKKENHKKKENNYI